MFYLNITLTDYYIYRKIASYDRCSQIDSSGLEDIEDKLCDFVWFLGALSTLLLLLLGFLLGVFIMLTSRFPMRQIGSLRPFGRDYARLGHRRMSLMVSKRRA